LNACIAAKLAANVRFGSKADVTFLNFDVRFTCPYRKSNPNVSMVQSSEERLGNDVANRLDDTRNRRILAQR
jgi:hypothetical protein